MFTVRKPEASLSHKLQKQFVYNAGGLQDVFGSLSAKDRASDTSQVRINKLKELFGRRWLSKTPLVEENCNVARFRHALFNLSGHQ